MTTKLNLREWATYLGVIRRRWIWVAAVFFPVSAAVAVTVFFLPRSFEADALILIERREPLMRKIPGGYDFDQYLLTLRQMMMSETNLRAIASKADMDLGKNEKALRGLVEKLQKSVYFKNKGRDLFEVRVSGDTAQEAYVLAGTVSSHLVETSLAIRRREAGVAYDFIQHQLENFRSKLQEAEERLKLFKSEHVEEMPGTEHTNLSRLQQTKTDLQAVQLQVRELAEKRTQLKEQIEMEEPMILASTDSAPAGMRVGQLEAMLAQALLRYTEKHPDVARLKAEIEAAKGAVAKGGKAAPTGGTGTTTANPVYQQLKASLAAVEADLAAAQAREAGLNARVGEYRRKTVSIPEAEQKYREIVRDVDVTAGIYSNLLKKLEDARIQKEVEIKDEGISLKIFDPAKLPLHPAKPNRPLIILIGVLAGLGLGGAVAVLRELLDRSFRSRQEVEAELHLPVIGAIPEISTPSEDRLNARRLRWAVVGTSAYLCVIAGVAGIELARQSGLFR
jgi:polysaccharide chain length determinant protein (PEP-CTERM system associated)